MSPQILESSLRLKGGFNWGFLSIIKVHGLWRLPTATDTIHSCQLWEVETTLSRACKHVDVTVMSGVCVKKGA